MHIKILILSCDQKMKCSAYASSAEALYPASFPFHGASLEGNPLCFIRFNQAYVSFIHTWSVLIQQSQAKLPILFEGSDTLSNHVWFG